VAADTSESAERWKMRQVDLRKTDEHELASARNALGGVYRVGYRLVAGVLSLLIGVVAGYAILDDSLQGIARRSERLRPAVSGIERTFDVVSESLLPDADPAPRGWDERG
jgi:hypothetical protein